MLAQCVGGIFQNPEITEQIKILYDTNGKLIHKKTVITLHDILT